ncbi:hypothetical protein KAFR_0A01440 [Kazachstania africana CBS 2517]|uniref:Potassium channel domain-containing protein n=1 Tax=Kazachstania africana (strain ATCC 22294 / BCRC 22015 / CBS 2517 / CECT 1963 / NBRC 1671 / NRRL Y-8276) TaxID=1071382 RepID=H2AMI2_KAZAF|nr:hypothetical protein KAFR_0A01440 [Kazachstania africana CBS 2517]CCF55582.1 hypothetical protein KAFR_0A01440 [Kazachstania africana CBS 2517]
MSEANGYNEEVPNRQAALKVALRFKNERISIINADPSSKPFLFWFIISCYFPVITACLGPIANTISIACVVDSWRIEEVVESDGTVSVHNIKDPRSLFVVNVMSLVFGFVSNIVLILHYFKKLSYLKSQIINIVGWTIAGGILLIDVVICSAHFMKAGEHRSIGFWYACITSGLYLGCTLTLTLHFIGYKLKKYPPTFNLLPNERNIMIFTVVMSIWLIWGPGLFSGLLSISWGNALYFCTVAVLTVGFGDILANNVASKIMILIFAMSGVLILGLIVFMTRTIISKSAGPILYFHKTELARLAALRKNKNGEVDLTGKEGFMEMQTIRKITRRKEIIYSVSMTLFVFTLFWLLGALVFHFAEGWSYFNAVYFCFLCLLTIGFGTDFSPKTGAGRAFFVIWGIAAVPLMSAILSTAGDLLYAFSSSLHIERSNRAYMNLKYIFLNGKEKVQSLLITQMGIFTGAEDEAEEEQEEEEEEEEEEEMEGGAKGQNYSFRNEYNTFAQLNSNNSDVSKGESSKELDSLDDFIEDPFALQLIRTNDTFSKRSINQMSKLKKIKFMLETIRRLHRISMKDEDFTLNFEQWSALISLAKPVEGIGPENSDFWVSENSPLRYPINEAQYAYLRLFKHVEEMVEELMTEAEDDSKNLNIRRTSLAGSLNKRISPTEESHNRDRL